MLLRANKALIIRCHSRGESILGRWLRKWVIVPVLKLGVSVPRLVSHSSSFASLSPNSLDRFSHNQSLGYLSLCFGYQLRHEFDFDWMLITPGMYALRERRQYVGQEDFEMAVAKVLKKNSENNMSVNKLFS